LLTAAMSTQQARLVKTRTRSPAEPPLGRHRSIGAQVHQPTGLSNHDHDEIAMPVEILNPELGESVSEATVAKWLKKSGDVRRGRTSRWSSWKPTR
jgi:hypothetical protein